MNNINIGVGSIANILTALETLGFTIDTTNNTAKWGFDTNDKLYFKLNTDRNNTTINLNNSSNNPLMVATLNITAASVYKITYGKIGNSIVFGFQPAAATGNYIHFAIIEPKDTDDSWLYITPYLSSSSVSKIIDENTEVSNTTYGYTSLYNGSANAIQICKYYDGIRFAKNVFITSVCSSFQNVGQGTATATANNYLEATIDTDTYLIINLTNSFASNKIAIKKDTVTS